MSPAGDRNAILRNPRHAKVKPCAGLKDGPLENLWVGEGTKYKKNIRGREN